MIKHTHIHTNKHIQTLGHTHTHTHTHIYIYIYEYGDIINFGKSDKMIKISGKVDKPTLTTDSVDLKKEPLLNEFFF